ncbi:hypothetical protein QZR14_15365 [Pseudomonas sp. rhizo66]|uniref:hypothetical protein n=1 Tax=Pseudomonas sp. rhizo66 TaxID=3059674 RepID=UPI00288F2AB9|nr:hypothetical protein [Pseudomonas sp. rhizo66]MDT3312737.1 hypothetical protein [Pseudomonas sp. rhizo66]
MSKSIAMALFVIGAATTNVYAAGVESCPPVNTIKSSAYTDTSVGEPHNTGFKYTASFNGKTWTGVTLSTNDDFLDKKYQLKAESFDGSICSYGGKTIIEKVDNNPANDKHSTPYLKLKSS